MSPAWWLGVIVDLGLASVLIYTVSVLAAAYATRRGVRLKTGRDDDYLKTLVAERRKAQTVYAQLLGDGYPALANRQLRCIRTLDKEIRKHS